VYVRDIKDGFPVVVAISTASSTQTLSLSSEEIAAGSYVDVLSGEVISVGDKPSAASWTLDSLRARVWVLESDPCR
jgi:hypothetical protein